MSGKAMMLAAAVALLSVAGHALGAEQKGAGAHAMVHRVGPKEFSLRAMEGVKAGVVAAGENQVFSVAAAGAAKTISVDLGWMAVEPGRAYRARCDFRVASLEAPTGVRLMIREHEGKGAKPITPYQVTPVSGRPVAAGGAGAALARELSFTTGANTHALSGAIVIDQLKGELHLAGFQLVDAAGESEQAQAAARAEQEKVLAEVRAKADARVPLTPRPLVYSRSQMKYGLELNYYHTWNDRPLLVNRAYRVPAQYVTPLPGYARQLQEVVRYDMDGLAFFPETKGRLGMFEVHGQTGVAGVGLLPEFFPKPGEDEVANKAEVIERALKCPSAPRLEGKVLITSYAANALTPAQWGQMLAALRARVGDKFLFLPALTDGAELRAAFSTGEPITRAQVEQTQRNLRAYLDVCDGIYFHYPAAFRTTDRVFDEAFYRGVFIPVFKSVLSEEPYRRKYLGLSAYKSHMSPDRGNNLHEDGTRTLRRSIEAAMDARPDVLVLPEWDEFNENTCWRPTVYGSNTTQRIVRYYMSRIKNVAPTPVPDDDAGIPKEGFLSLLHLLPTEGTDNTRDR